MFNRSSASAKIDPAFARRSALELSARRHLRSAPAAPEWIAQVQSFTGAAALEQTQLAEVRARVFALPESVASIESELLENRRHELDALWREAVATMCYSTQIARIQKGAVGGTLLAALLHRAGQALAIRALALAELEQNVQLDPPSTADWLTRNSGSMFDSLASGWGLSDAVRQIVHFWQAYAEDDQPAEAHAVYFGHVLAMELLYPEWSSPAAIDAAASELHLNAETLEWVRGERTEILKLLTALDAAS